MTYAVLFVVGIMALLVIFRSWRGRKPEDVTLPAENVLVVRLAGLWSVGLGCWFLIDYVNDPAVYPRLAISLLMFVVGAQALTAPSFANPTELQRGRFTREIARRWWVFPVFLTAFSVFLPLELLAPRQVASAYLTAVTSGFVVASTWRYLRLRRIARSN